MYHIFISHAWRYDEAYNTIIDWLKRWPVSYKNYSVPEASPLHVGSKAELKRDLTEQIKHANCVIVISGMYAAYSDWIDYEIDEAVRMGKYIIGVRPRGQEHVPLKIQQNAAKMVGWNSSSVVHALR